MSQKSHKKLTKDLGTKEESKKKRKGAVRPDDEGQEVNEEPKRKKGKKSGTHDGESESVTDEEEVDEEQRKARRRRKKELQKEKRRDEDRRAKEKQEKKRKRREAKKEKKRKAKARKNQGQSEVGSIEDTGQVQTSLPESGMDPPLNEFSQDDDDNGSGPKDATERIVLIDSASFADYSQPGVVYVDKTRQLMELLKKGSGYFVNRPRRFGKSLFLDTLACYFRGEKELFRGTAIFDDPSVSWDEWPVIELDMSLVKKNTLADLEKALQLLVKDVAEEDHGISLPDRPPALLLINFISTLHIKTGKKVVILVDEYDSPILSLLESGASSQVVKECEVLLSTFYGAIKTTERDGHLKFRFMTGISHLVSSAFGSSINNLQEIDSFDSLALSTLFGYTLDEVKKAFAPEISAMAKKLGQTVEEIEDTMLEYYNGYNWHECGDAAGKVMNPFSLNSLMTHQKFNLFWAGKGFGMPSWLASYLCEFDFLDVAEVEGVEIRPRERKALSQLVEHPNVDSLRLILYESGFLTNEKNVKFPNLEVKQGFQETILSLVVESKASKKIWQDLKYDGKAVVRCLSADNIEGFFKEIQRMLNELPNIMYDKKQLNLADIRSSECYYHAILCATLTVLSTAIKFEYEVNCLKGRLDLLIATPTTVFVIELKMGRDADSKKALKQIRGREYADVLQSGDRKEKYGNRKVTLVGVAFNFKAWKKVTVAVTKECL
eukprot:m.304964 g.304964  ORF g.304964 m.304964 type:complete len:720 (+) comp40850_c0_seq2:94-2253(+)